MDALTHLIPKQYYLNHRLFHIRKRILHTGYQLNYRGRLTNHLSLLGALYAANRLD